MPEPMSDDLLEALRAQCDKPGRVFFFRAHARALVDEVERLRVEVAARDHMCACNADEKWMHDTTCPRGILAWDGADWQTNGYYADADGFAWYLCSVLPTGEPLFTPLAGDMDVTMPLSDVLVEGGSLTPCPRPDVQPDQN